MSISKAGIIILDGWGYRAETKYNAIAQAHTPYFDELIERYPHAFIEASGKHIGLPDGQMGNSEVGHLSIGAGRIIKQNLQRINESSCRDFADNAVLNACLAQAQQQQQAIHVMGLYSPGGVHAHEEHINALLRQAARQKVVCYLHLILDGRDTGIYQSLQSVSNLQQLLQQRSIKNYVKIASVCGRFYAMDRDNRWQRTQRYFDLVTGAQGIHTTAPHLLQCLQQQHQQLDGKGDEFMPPIVVDGFTIVKHEPIVLMNFRIDRMRQISQLLLQHHYSITTLTQYSPDYDDVPVAFAHETPANHLGAWLAQHQLRQLRIAETEKYPHVTFFFNGGEDVQLPGEERILVHSPKVKTYDLEPQMSAEGIADAGIKALTGDNFDFFVLNFANADMVGHTGSLAATICAVETVDRQLRRVVEAARQQGFELMVTADHGNADRMFDEQSQLPHTAHTLALVPLIVISNKQVKLNCIGSITQIAPSILQLMNLPVPDAMLDSLVCIDERR